MNKTLIGFVNHCYYLSMALDNRSRFFDKESLRRYNHNLCGCKSKKGLQPLNN